MKRTLCILLTGLLCISLMTSLPSCKKLAKSGGRLLLADKKERSRSSGKRKKNSDKKTSATGLVGEWGVEYDLENGGYLYIGLDFEDDDTFYFMIEISDKSYKELLSCSFSGNYSQVGDVIYYTTDTSSFTYELNSSVDDPIELLDYVNQLRSGMYDWSEDKIVLVNADKLILKDLSDGEETEYFRE